MGAQQLDGYGQECFLAKDDTGNEVLIGASLIGEAYFINVYRVSQKKVGTLGKLFVFRNYLPVRR